MTGTEATEVVIQERDRRLFKELDTMRVIDREQAKIVAGFGSTTRVNTRLLMLTRAGLLKRYFVGTIAGGRKAVYALSNRGAQVVNACFRGIRRKPGRLLSGDQFLEHQLRVNSVLITVKHQPIPVIGVQFIRWMNFYQPVATAIPLIPDGYFELESSKRTLCLFVEVDLHTETRRIWRAKIQHYLRLATSGEFSRRFHQAQFRVLVIGNSDRRMESLRATAAPVTDKIFRFTTFQLIHSDGFWSAVWLRPSGDRRQALV